MRKGIVAGIALCIGLSARIAISQAPVKLTLQDAKTMALANHPQVLGAQNEASYSDQQIIVARAPYFPTIDADLTGSQGNSLARIGAGALAASRLFTRFGQGLVFSQMVTDLGRTQNLVASSRFQAQSTAQTYQATQYDVLLEVNRAYFSALHAQAEVKVARETLDARQLVLDQITTLANNNLRSQLDVSFVDVNVAQAKLLLLTAQNDVQVALADLTRAMGSDRQDVTYDLVDEPLPQGPPSTPDALVVQALNSRPEITSFRAARDAAQKFFQAESDLERPSMNLIGAAGFLPIINNSAGHVPAAYEGVALNIDIPVFNGHLFSARKEAARYKLNEADQRLRDAQERIARDVRAAWANATNAFQRLAVTAQFLQQASLAVDLAKGRYDNGLATIVELTQGQLNVTQAQIENLSAIYDYQIQNAALQYSVGLLR